VNICKIENVKQLDIFLTG